ncbi:MAG: asparaginase [Geminicoccaceae bacterium]
MRQSPLIVEVWRGPHVESRHRVHACVIALDEAGKPSVMLEAGEIGTAMLPRSAIKPFQALPVVESGAADVYGCGDTQLALACASHSGEPVHRQFVDLWLTHIGLSADALLCGGHPSQHEPTAQAEAARAIRPSRLHDNCSGKHAGMLTLARYAGDDITDYVHPDHPVQRAAQRALSDLADEAVPRADAADGCNAPAFAMSLHSLALAYARLASGRGLSQSRAQAAGRIVRAMVNAPLMVAGHGRLCTLLMVNAPHLIAKTGAEGVYGAAWGARGLGLALKVDDGATRASEVALMALLHWLDAFAGARPAALAHLARPAIRSRTGDAIGHIALAADALPTRRPAA